MRVVELLTDSGCSHRAGSLHLLLAQEKPGELFAGANREPGPSGVQKVLTALPGSQEILCTVKGSIKRRWVRQQQRPKIKVCRKVI